MATNTLIQYLGTSQTTGLGVSAAVGGDNMDRAQFETFICSAVVTAGDWLVFDTTASGANRVLTVKQAPATAGNPLVVGVAAETTTASGQKVKVCISGYWPTANVTANVGEALTTSGANAGRAIKYDASVVAHQNTGPIGVALATSAANVAPVWIYKHFA